MSNQMTSKLSLPGQLKERDGKRRKTVFEFSAANVHLHTMNETRCASSRQFIACAPAERESGRSQAGCL
jgi:hypothetical protein